MDSGYPIGQLIAAMPDYLRWSYYPLEIKAFIIPLVLTILLSLLVCWRYAVGNPVKKFRPPFGRVVLVGIVLCGCGAVASFVVATMIVGGEQMARSMSADPSTHIGDGRRSGGVDVGDGGTWDGMGDRTGGAGKPALPSFFKVPATGSSGGNAGDD